MLSDTGRYLSRCFAFYSKFQHVVCVAMYFDSRTLARVTFQCDALSSTVAFGMCHRWCEVTKVDAEFSASIRHWAPATSGWTTWMCRHMLFALLAWFSGFPKVARTRNINILARGIAAAQLCSGKQRIR
ncbi:unnamed protein product [Prorocentrum cordatum]|uniref:Uncharacterized protein n=1 Tax=Prorocentrum cordatum TaxID=2364126 RepID=A0ABN9VZZ1_9DINO|nr:unnamed protein product [Polarella glacialis]